MVGEGRSDGRESPIQFDAEFGNGCFGLSSIITGRLQGYNTDITRMHSVLNPFYLRVHSLF